MAAHAAMTGDGDNMAGYRCYILDAEDHILQAHDLDCQDDADAVSVAQNLLTLDPYHHGAEVWRSTRRIKKLQRTAGLGLRLARRVQPKGRTLGSVV
jgi:hypothetical protein